MTYVFSKERSVVPGFGCHFLRSFLRHFPLIAFQIRTATKTVEAWEDSKSGIRDVQIWITDPGLQVKIGDTEPHQTAQLSNFVTVIRSSFWAIWLDLRKSRSPTKESPVVPDTILDKCCALASERTDFSGDSAKARNVNEQWGKYFVSVGCDAARHCRISIADQTRPKNMNSQRS